MATTVLLDRNLRDLGLRAEGAVKVDTFTWGDRHHTVAVHGYKGKPLPAERWKREQLACLPTIARLAREQRLRIFSSVELQVEEMRASVPFRGRPGDIFRGVEIEELPSAVERTYFHQTIDFRKYLAGESQAAFIDEFLLKLDEATLLPQLLEHIDLPEFDANNLRTLQRFRELCRGLNTADHRRDAYHLWTAEVHGLDYFLTADKRFVNVMTQTKRIDLRTRPITPDLLLATLGVSATERIPLADGAFRRIFDPE